MRATTFVVFWRFIGAAGVGSFLGAAVAGLVAVVTARVFADGSPWVTGLPVLAVLGALVMAGVARLTRFWLVPRLVRHRMLWGAVAGSVVTPLAVAVGQLGDLLPVALVMPIGSVVTAALWVRWFRGRHQTSRIREHVLRTR